MIALAFAIGLAVTFGFAGGLPTPSLSLILESAAWLALANGVVCVIAIGLASLTGSRPGTITALIGWELVLSPLLVQVDVARLGAARPARRGAAVPQARSGHGRSVDPDVGRGGDRGDRRLAAGPAGARGLADADPGRLRGRGVTLAGAMRKVSTTVAAVRDAIRRHPWWTDSLLALFLTVISVGSVVFVARDTTATSSPVLDAILVPFTTLRSRCGATGRSRCWRSRSAPRRLLLIFSSEAQVPVGVIVALYTVASRCERPVSIRAAAWVALPITAGVIVNNGPHPGAVIPELAVFAIAWVVGDNLRTRRAYLAELEARAARLEREREEKAERAVVEERARIARELHDVIAHNVSVMVVQASAGEEVFDADPERARESLSAVASTGRAALAELRRLLGVIRAEDERRGRRRRTRPSRGSTTSTSWSARCARPGSRSSCRCSASRAQLPEGVGLCAYRIVQEALTNTLKHASASSAQVSVRYVADALELQVLDDGRGAPPVGQRRRRPGHGLIGMRERVALFGGELTARPRAGARATRSARGSRSRQRGA